MCFQEKAWRTALLAKIADKRRISSGLSEQIFVVCPRKASQKSKKLEQSYNTSQGNDMIRKRRCRYGHSDSCNPIQSKMQLRTCKYSRMGPLNNDQQLFSHGSMELRTITCSEARLCFATGHLTFEEKALRPFSQDSTLSLEVKT